MNPLLPSSSPREPIGRGALLVSLLVGLASTASAQLIFDNFNSYDGFTTGTAPLSANWSVGLVPPSGSIVNTTGIGASQGLDGPISNDEWRLTHKTGINLANGAVTVSFFYRAGSGNPFAEPQVSLVPTDTSYYNSGNGEVALRISGNAWGTRINNGGGPAISVAEGVAPNAVAGNWYQYNTTFTLVSATQISVVGSLYNADANGVVGSLFSSTSTANLTQATLATDTSLFVSLRMHTDAIDVMDNFTVSQIPEPSTFGLLAAGAVGSLVALRRRKR